MQIMDNENRITHEQLLELLSYDPDTGIFVRKVATARCLKVGDVAGSPHICGYLEIALNGKRYLAHRLAWFYFYGAWPTKNLDHINGDCADNRISNLREASHSENAQNLRKARSNNKSSGLLGVSKNGKWWHARICLNGERRYLGTFLTPQEAHMAYLSAKQQIHPFGNL